MKALLVPKSDSGVQGSQPSLIFLENPDGSLGLGLPPGVRVPSPPPSPRHTLPSVRRGRLSIGFDSTFHRHEQLFSALLLTELIVEFIFNVLFISCAAHSVQEVSMLYTNLPHSALWRIFWVLFVCEMSYVKLYYGLGFTAIYKNRPRLYTWFTNVALAGIVGQVLFAYMNAFNLLIFLLRLASYVYAKFMRSQLERAALVPVTVEV